jgi:hypothetical protein
MSKLYFCYNNKSDYYDEINFILENPTFETSLIFYFFVDMESMKRCKVVILWNIIVIYTISGIKALLQDSSVKIADDEGVSPSSSVITRVSCNML